MNVRTASAPATAPQISFLETLLEQRVVDAGFAQRVQDKIDNPETFFKGQASDAIGFLKAQPYKPREAVASDVDLADEPGIYEVGGVVFQVKWNKIKTHVYALRLENGEYSYAGAIYKNKIAKTDRISVDRAIELSALRGSCIRCGRVLKVAKSVRDGIGPVCIKAI